MRGYLWSVAGLLRKWGPPRIDALLAAGVCAAALVCVYVSPLSAPSGYARPGDGLGVLVAVGMTVPLAWRRRRPLVGLAIAAVFAELSNLRNYATDPADIFTWFALGSAAFYTRRRTSVGLAVLGLAYEWYWWDQWSWPSVVISNLTWAVATGVVPVVLGDMMRTQRQHAAAIAERERRVQELEAANAVESERLRIARELHDIVGHHLSAIGVQARAIALLVGREPDRAVAELQQLGRLAGSALSETRQSVALLRAGASDSGPQPRLHQIDDLARAIRSQGVDVRVRRAGVARPLRESVELCVYRIVQEGLTNVVKHSAPPATADVTIRFERASLEVEVLSRGERRVSQMATGGHGLAGMRERVELAAGQLRCEAIDARTWVVQATIPA